MAINVRLLDHTTDPTRSLYLAYRVAYSALTPQQIADRIETEKITREQMHDFIEKRLETGHASPLEQVWFRVRHLRRLARLQPPVRPPPRRHQLRAAVPALRRLQEGRVPLHHPRHREAQGLRRQDGGRVRPARRPVRGDDRRRRPGRGRALPPPQRHQHQLQGHRELPRAAAHLRPAAVHARAVGVPPGGVADARADQPEVPGAGEVHPAEVRRQALGLLRRVSRGLGEVPDRQESARTRSSSSSCSTSTARAASPP